MNRSMQYLYFNYLFLQEKYQMLVDFKEKILRSFFRLRYIAPIFKYITPNDLCYLRIMAAIGILYLYLRGHFWWMLPLFIIAVFLDFIDGPLARETNRVTEEGKTLDPIADKVLISVPLLVIGIDKFDMQTILMFLLVEGLLVLLANYLKPYLRDKFDIPLMSGSNMLGQIKMFCQAIAVGLLLYDPNSVALVRISEIIIWFAIGFGIGSFLRHLARMSRPVEPKKRIITIPNLITLSAIFLFIPAGVAVVREQWVSATILIIWILASDVLDGWTARRFNQITDFGAVLDPIRDDIIRYLAVGWLFLKLDNLIVRLIIIVVVIVELSINVICVLINRHFKSEKLVDRGAKVRAIVHSIFFLVLFGHILGVYILSSIWLIAIFATILVFSVRSLIYYRRQRTKLMIEKSKKRHH